ncbi:MAG: hypothetical protein GTO45_39300 [Candidatus Aminicenantes bacterium]|nr:hypothetical protein [Candidatus Aminicenantes bacterium]NIM84676.1 hypothetical protein [Candidatus Aminicenantes bacterium]NIN24175.1 hypothetical protein [Candidatus Aminicenantes bacterium]NIN47900.1 hypothetical protein [Candidatus Aminicenantes bacterium]NIN90838.1 hypothetical protein [Candidatus Aminicenantes bacterium]
MKKIRSNSKTLTVDILLLLVIILILSVSVFAQKNNQQNQDQTIQKQIQTQPENPVSQRVTKLKKELQLTETQTAAVREILEKGQKQAEKDQETFKTNAKGLIETAWDRRKAFNALIEEQLDDRQKEKFKKMTRMTLFDRELFDLIEGLLLDDDQAFTVEGILIKYYNQFNEFIPEEIRERMEDEDSPPGGRRFAPYGKGMGMRGAGMLKSFVERLQAKKNRAIKKILSKEQKNLFKQLNEHRQKQMEEWQKQRRKNQKGKRNNLSLTQLNHLPQIIIPGKGFD